MTSHTKDPRKEDELVSQREPSKVDFGGVEGGADVDYSTISTTEPSPQNHHGGAPVDGSDVISAITDHASLGGTMNPPSFNATGPVVSSLDVAVPAQVILPDNDATEQQQHDTTAPEVSSLPNSLGAPVPSEQIPSASSAADAQLEPAPVAPQTAQETEPLPPARSEGVMATPPTQQKQQNSSLPGDDVLDDYIRSPEVQNAIVERSPGGRYVRFMEKLGSGASKDVYRAYDTQEGIEVAWNVVTLSGVPKTERNRIVNEVRLLERLHHPNIISFHGSWVNRERQEVNFVTEILSSGTLKSFINKVQVIRWKIAKRWGMQILKGLEYLHSQDPPVIHRDLKCENVFINGTSGDLRIGDLGLSTVHRNGRVLSVLGTPEFMAPDMYEERSYDEKVDIYAFGMCMLEIFTKEIPYSECNNPAQIYKKVSSGEQPEVLARLQSRHARDFVELCLGYKDENGIYVRPSASELLKHPFLMKRPSDDDEVVVEPPLRERTIAETTTENSNGISLHWQKQSSSVASASAVSNPQQAKPSQGQIGGGAASSELRPGASFDDADGNDQFNEMPESETNMKKVKVLMGRDQVLTEEEDTQHAPAETHSAESAPAQPIARPMNEVAVEQRPPTQSNDVPAPPAPQPMPVQQAQSETLQPEVAQSQSDAASTQYSQEVAPQKAVPEPRQPEPRQQSDVTRPEQRHYLVAAAVIENEGPDIRPYADDILKLVVTLPVEGQTQNVQFEFHLVEDDAVKVAKEMVQELDIPQDAVLEISETISALACSARMKQDKYTARMKDRVQQQQQSAPQTNDGVQSSLDHSASAQTAGATAAMDASQAPPLHSQPLSEEVSHVQTESAVSQIQQSQQPKGAASQPLHVGQVQPSATFQSTTVQARSVQPQHVQVADSTQPPLTVQQANSASYQTLPPQNQAPDPAPPQPSHQVQPQASVDQSGPLQRPTQQVLQVPAPVSHVVPDHVAAQPAQAPLVQQAVSAGVPQAVNAQAQPSGLHVVSEQMTAQHVQVPIQPSAQVAPGVLPAGHTVVAPSQQAVPQGFPHVPSSHTISSAASVAHLAPNPATTSSQAAPAQQVAAETVQAQAEPQPTQVVSATPVSPVPSTSGAPPRPPSVLSAETMTTGQGDAASRSSDMNGISPVSNVGVDDDEEEVNEELRDQLRKLEEDYQKNLKIAKKVFDSRMENLERSQTEKEAQHQKTLEKHEKERAAFEKRRALEEEQQLRRIEQLQKEWDKKRATLAQQKKGAAASSAADAPLQAHNETTSTRPLPTNGAQDHHQEPQAPPAAPVVAQPQQVQVTEPSVSSAAAATPAQGAPPDPQEPSQ